MHTQNNTNKNNDIDDLCKFYNSLISINNFAPKEVWGDILFFLNNQKNGDVKWKTDS